MSAHVVVVGGGPAGLAAAGGLARNGVAATVLEAGCYPRNRMCGEFLSPDASDALAALGCDRLADDLDAPVISGLRVTVASGGRVRAELRTALPRPGRGVSRIDLDAALAGAARRAGAAIREGARVVSVDAADDGVVARTGAGDVRGDALIVATGRLARPTGASDAVRRGRRWVAAKVHVRGLRLPGVTELHVVRGAYVGLNEVACGGERRVNVCALVRQDVADAAEPGVAAIFEALAARSPSFARRWRDARPVEGSEVAAAGFTFSQRGARTAGGPRPALVCGDAAALIAPLAGDGQAMALAAGVSAARTIASRCAPDRRLPAGAVHAAALEFERACAAETRTRLRAGRLLQSALLRPLPAVLLVRALASVRAAPDWLYRLTRGAITDRSGACAVRSS